MRTIEILLVITILTSAFLVASFYAVLPSPRQVSPLNLRRLALTTLETLDNSYALSTTTFKPVADYSWNSLQMALSASLPPNIVYNLTVYGLTNTSSPLAIKSISNAASLGIGSDAASYLAASSNVTFSVTPQKIGQGKGGTLYILNCSDASGWWITGYTSQQLAQDLENMLSPYFQKVITVNNTSQLGQILNGTKLSTSPNENVTGAVIINTNGECVPIPSGYYSTQGSQDAYAKYCWILGQRVLRYNWTWASIVGYPFYYVSNTGLFPNSQNGWGIYGMNCVAAAGLNSFLEGLDNQSYVNNGAWITDSLSGHVYISSKATYYSNYYGIYPSPYQTATRALQTFITTTYHLTISTYVFSTVGNDNPGAMYRHGTKGGFMALGLDRPPDIRLTALGLLSDYQPRIFNSQYDAYGTSRLVVLQLGQVGGT
jgi:hypothetical protein